jgi:hypothetical protein
MRTQVYLEKTASGSVLGFLGRSPKDAPNLLALAPQQNALPQDTTHAG